MGGAGLEDVINRLVGDVGFKVELVLMVVVGTDGVVSKLKSEISPCDLYQMPFICQSSS